MKTLISLEQYVLLQNKETRPAHETLKLINEYTLKLQQQPKLNLNI